MEIFSNGAHKLVQSLCLNLGNFHARNASKPVPTQFLESICGRVLHKDKNQLKSWKNAEKEKKGKSKALKHGKSVKNTLLKCFN